MKIAKRIQVLVLCVLMLVSAVAFAGCNKEDGDGTTTGNSGVAKYKVTVVDGLGNPYTEKVIVRFMQGTEQVAMAPINASGVVEKELNKGDYTVQISTTEGECWYDPANVSLSGDKTELTVNMAYVPAGESSVINAAKPGTEDHKDYKAMHVGTGSSYIALEADDRVYVVFYPTEAGVYEFSTTGGNVELGNYGSTYYVQPNSIAEVKDGKFSVNVRQDMIGQGATGTTSYVIGIDAKEGTTGTILNICRTGDPEWTIEDEPWQVYKPAAPAKPFTLPEGTTLKEFDLTAATDSYKLVYNEEDDCYHLNAVDGPAVYVQLDEAMYGISMKAMVGEIIYQDGVLMQSGTAPFRYMYFNSKEDFFKEDYTDPMREYVTNRDAKSGVYPLNKDLEYMLKKGIEFNGWATKDHGNYLFAEVEGINNEIAWMFMLVHADEKIPPVDEPVQGGDDQPPVQGGNDTPNQGGNENSNQGGNTTTQKPIEDNKNEPIIVGGTLKFDAEVKANHIVYFDLLKVNDTILTIRSNDAYVIYDGTTYKAKNGVVTVYGLYSQYTNEPVKIAIGNSGTKDAKFSVTLSYPSGHRENPKTMKLGTTTTESEAGNDQGVYYTMTATKTGKLTVNITSISGKNKAGVTIVKVVDGVPQQVETGDGETSVSIDVNEGDKLTVIVSVLPNIKNKYPAATIKTDAKID